MLSQGALDLPDDPPAVGYKNAEIELPLDVLRRNMHAVQDRQNLEHSRGGALGDRALPELEVEMETGTGKTFVYIKTIFEQNMRYGWSKFIIIVPGIAIREGVKKSLDIMADKFLADYGKTAKTYVYNLAHPQDVLDFSTNADRGAKSIIVAHNHPTGDPTPSEEDVAVTSQLKAAAEIVSIPLKAHLVIGKEDYVVL